MLRRTWRETRGEVDGIAAACYTRLIMIKNTFLLIALAAALCSVAACSSESESPTATAGSAPESEPQDDNAPPSTEPDMPSKDAAADAFAEKITKALTEGDTEIVIAHITPVNLPEGWESMIKPMLEDLKGRDLTGAVRPRSEFTNEDLHWPAETPEPLKVVEDILEVSYDAGDESGRRTFPLVYRDDEWRILLGQ